MEAFKKAHLFGEFGLEMRQDSHQSPRQNLTVSAHLNSYYVRRKSRFVDLRVRSIARRCLSGKGSRAALDRRQFRDVTFKTTEPNSTCFRVLSIPWSIPTEGTLVCVHAGWPRPPVLFSGTMAGSIYSLHCAAQRRSALLWLRDHTWKI